MSPPLSDMEHSVRAALEDSRCKAALFSTQLVNGLQVGGALSVHQTSARPIARLAPIKAQFKGPDEPGGLTRDNEPDEFFATNFGVTACGGCPP